MTGPASAEDCAAALLGQVRSAVRDRAPLVIEGNGSKSFYGRPAQGRPLKAAGHRGIVRYEPTELVVVARAGTPLAELESALAAEGQMLGFEPPYFGSDATIGGTIACGFSGPRRPFAGSARDCVLGCRLINGRGEIVSFGGEVIKNVAGFDLSRLMVGAMGTLGVLLEIALKVLPAPETETTVAFDTTPDQARSMMLHWASMPLPVSALAYDGRLRVRLSGCAEAVAAARRQMGGDVEAAVGDFWVGLREQVLPFFRAEGDLWRFSLPPAAAAARITGNWLIDWGGALRWLKTTAEPGEVFTSAGALGGHASLFRGVRGDSRFQPLAANLLALQRRVKLAFDPDGLFNVGRLNEAW